MFFFKMLWQVLRCFNRSFNHSFVYQPISDIGDIGLNTQTPYQSWRWERKLTITSIYQKYKTNVSIPWALYTTDSLGFLLYVFGKFKDWFIKKSPEEEKKEHLLDIAPIFLFLFLLFFIFIFIIWKVQSSLTKTDS